MQLQPRHRNLAFLLVNLILLLFSFLNQQPFVVIFKLKLNSRYIPFLVCWFISPEISWNKIQKFKEVFIESSPSYIVPRFSGPLTFTSKYALSAENIQLGFVIIQYNFKYSQCIIFGSPRSKPTSLIGSPRIDFAPIRRSGIRNWWVCCN